jgi:hypothetical protein
MLAHEAILHLPYLYYWTKGGPLVFHLLGTVTVRASTGDPQSPLNRATCQPTDILAL